MTEILISGDPYHKDAGLTARRAILVGIVSDRAGKSGTMLATPLEGSGCRVRAHLRHPRINLYMLSW